MPFRNLFRRSNRSRRREHVLRLLHHPLANRSLSQAQFRHLKLDHLDRLRLPNRLPVRNQVVHLRRRRRSRNELVPLLAAFLVGSLSAWLEFYFLKM